MSEQDKEVILALANHGMKIAKAAKALYMHPNTVRYHIRKVKQVTGLDPMKFYDLYKLVCEFRGNV